MVEFTVFKGSHDGKIVKSTSTREIGPNEVLVKITHSGLCGTDVHYKGQDIVLGHEGVGVVEKIGSNVTMFKVGERAGWGYMQSSCNHCKQCYRGWETMCDTRETYGVNNFDQGSLASHAVWREDWLFHIPDNMSSEDAAPLMCGGATVFSPLQCFDLKPTHRVGVLGIGGLGHLAIQFAAKMGCEVVVFSGTESKKEEAFKLGAKEFYATKGVSDLTKIVTGGTIDHLLVTMSGLPDWKLYFPIMTKGGTIYPLSVSMDDFVTPYLPLITQGLRIQGSMVATRQVHADMLRFAAVHGIKPINQTFPMTTEGIEQAFEALEKGTMRYRGVLVA